VTRVLVADDSETVLLMLRRRLEDEGYEVITAEDGKEALEAIEGPMAPDVVLLDAMMPRMSGIDALRQMRAAGNRVPVVIISAHGYGEDPEDAVRLGADDCVGKPFDWDCLLERIKELAS